MHGKLRQDELTGAGNGSQAGRITRCPSCHSNKSRPKAFRSNDRMPWSSGSRYASSSKRLRSYFGVQDARPADRGTNHCFKPTIWRKVVRHPPEMGVVRPEFALNARGAYVVWPNVACCSIRKSSMVLAVVHFVGIGSYATSVDCSRNIELDFDLAVGRRISARERSYKHFMNATRSAFSCCGQLQCPAPG